MEKLSHGKGLKPWPTFHEHQRLNVFRRWWWSGPLAWDATVRRGKAEHFRRRPYYDGRFDW